MEDELITQQNIAPSVTPYGFDCAYVLGCVTKPYVSTSAGGSQNAPTYNFSLLYEATPDVSFYLRAASGFRLGGINEEATIASQTGTAIPFFYGSDSLWDYEAGYKFYLFNRSLYFDFTAFVIDWSNEQENAIAHGTFAYIINAGKTVTNGLEFDATWKPTPELTFSGGLTYVNARLDSNLPASVSQNGTPGVAGDPMPFVPQWQATGQAEYDHPLDGCAQRLRAGGLHLSRQFVLGVRVWGPVRGGLRHPRSPAYWLLRPQGRRALGQV